MCGIAGIVNLGKETGFQAEDLLFMTNAMRHRGPDDEGFLLYAENGYTVCYGDDTPLPKDNIDTWPNDLPRIHISEANRIPSHIALGHRRLSIIDLSFSGHQPMSYLNRYWIVYNGEIYNYIEIRQELAAKGYTFHSSSDTEVILAAYDCWGPQCLKKFNGMWAFVIFDSLGNRLFLSRDRFGIKPLYYYKDDKVFLFASEIKSILAHRKVRTAPNLAYCREYLAHGPKDYLRETAFENIFRFPHASFLEIEAAKLKDDNWQEEIFWSCEPNMTVEAFDTKKAQAYAQRYYELLSDAVRIRLRADVKIGAALSGGLDSSTIVYLMNEHLKQGRNTEKLETFSNVYQSEGVQYCDESNYIDKLSDFLHVKSNQIEPQLDDIMHEHAKMVYAMENPPGGPNMGGWYTFKLVGQSDVTINLDGQGADEQMAGYLTYLWRYFTNLPLSELLSEWKAFAALPGVNKTYLLTSVIANLARRILPLGLLEKYSGYFGDTDQDKPSIFTPVNEILYRSIHTNLVTLIHLGDSQSMAHSIESRLPFMDYRLVEFLASVPANYKIHNGWTKYIARLAMDKKLPDMITWRMDKMGWPDPSEYWFRGPLKEWLCREVETSPFLQGLGVENNIRARIRGREPVIQLIRLLNLSVWYRVFFPAE